jgi:hypothetical protein
LKYKELFDFDRRVGGKKRGTPEYEGISLDVYENKGRKIQHFGFAWMCMKSNDLYISSGDVCEK